MNSKDYSNLLKRIYKKLKAQGVKNENVIEYDSICGQVGRRVNKLQQFAHDNDIIIFVSSKKSSNGKYLYNLGRIR